MKPCMGTGVYTSVTWRIRLNDSCAAAMRQLTLITCLSCQYFLFFLATKAQSLLSCAGHGVSAGRIILITVPRIGQRSIVMTVSVCVCLSVRDHIFGTTRPIFTNFFVHGSVRGLVLFWWRTDTICTSGFMDDVIFTHKPRLLDVATSLSAVHTQPWAWL